MRRPTTVTYGRYTIKAMQVKNECEARAYIANAKQGSGEVARATAPEEQAVIEKIREKLDANDRSLKMNRRFDERMKFHVPSKREYIVGLGIAEFTKAQTEMLKAHAAVGDVGMTATDLARSGGYADYSTANMQYGNAGRRLADALHIKLPWSKSRDEELPTGVIGYWLPTPGDQDGIGRWVMYPELREAVSELPL